MFITTIIIGLLCLYKIQFADSKNNRTLTGGYYNDYLSIPKTNSIKGLFILFIICSHSINYITLDKSILNRLFDFFTFQFMDQGVVTMFLFYSGYAMMLCGMERGSSYYKSIPTKRVLKVLFNFDIAIVLFIILGTAMGKTYSFVHILTSLVAYTSVGNSNWYIFAILILYIITYIAFMIGKDNKKAVLAIAFSLTVVYMIVMMYVDLSSERYYNTALLYPLGMLFYVYKDKVDNLFKSKKWAYYAAFAVFSVVFVLSYLLKAYLPYGIIKNAMFGILVLLLTMKVQVHNNILEFCGKHLFSIFMLQRIPMILLSHFGLNENIPLFLILVTVFTMVIAVLFDMVIGKLDDLIFKRKPKAV